MDNICDCYCSELLKKDENFKLSFSNDVYSIFGNANKGEKVILKYFGKLISDENVEEKMIFLNYGYGNLWDDKMVLEMTLCSHSDKTCFCAEIDLINNENLFFCFMDNNNIWDLNDNSSYTLQIGDQITTLAKKEVAVSLANDEYISPMNKLINKITDSLIKFFYKIGDIFDKRIKA
jgi:hypothetical protein